ncbi:putative circadian clock protein, KaiC [Chloroherpeton thalassium ATCC 35110]|uniref:non-specific serine/threonine protein kinase n=1 Tax=Chloroherpeton thalassium (strain ATCC 35110 / GB-78) TaxID=517418 RepID=B3QSF7_CHLT3|nr:circadian clock protein KaiC [Chloroherpeton thalassium]ACF12548.1 putative circadian clock protein, KaiC [Chloroherpeton thalassium ATCC 35110]
MNEQHNPMSNVEKMKAGLPKCPTGIKGLDEVLFGGIPKGRSTMVLGNAGCGKTLLAMEFLVQGIQQFGAHGLFVSFEEKKEDLLEDMQSFGWNLEAAEQSGALLIKHLDLGDSEFLESGEYDLGGLFVRLEFAIDKIGAKRVVLDTVETLFTTYKNVGALRTEFRRLIRWLKSKGVTVIITGETDSYGKTRHGIEAFVSDCVVQLDNRIQNQVPTRRLRVLKYRGSFHGTNEYPFIISEQGLSLLPITSVGLNYDVATDFVPSGLSSLDELLGGRGFYRGSSVLLTGAAGTGKSSLASQFAQAACGRGEKCLYLNMEESVWQIVRNMRSIGVELEPFIEKGLLLFEPTRSTMCGLEYHLVKLIKLLETYEPQHLIIDPVSSFLAVGESIEVKSMMSRLIDYLKMRHITTIMTNLSDTNAQNEITQMDISSLMDTWMTVQMVRNQNEQNRLIYIIKSRGMGHSNQMREFLITSEGIHLMEVYRGQEGVRLGTARTLQEARDSMEDALMKDERELILLQMARKRKILDAQIESLRSEYEYFENELKHQLHVAEMRKTQHTQTKEKIEEMRGYKRGY